MHAIDGRIFLSGIKYFSLKRFFHKDIPNESLDPKTTLLEKIFINIIHWIILYLYLHIFLIILVLFIIKKGTA